MEKEFVPYDRSLRLKALGFDKPCLLHVTHYGEMKETRSSLWMFNGYLAECNDDEKITIDYEFPNYPSNKEEYWQEINIPTFSQAFRWFREEHGLYYHIVPEFYMDGINFNWQILWYLPKEEWTHYVINTGTMMYGDNGEYPTQEEAELACLEKLIEIVENK